ncbi:MAG: hypothetical protein M3Y73_06135 [Actinomycetota bacterium]|nr:hypothetical protein [Actinomycetota bacterium]
MDAGANAGPVSSAIPYGPVEITFGPAGWVAGAGLVAEAPQPCNVKPSATAIANATGPPPDRGRAGRLPDPLKIVLVTVSVLVCLAAARINGV